MTDIVKAMLDAADKADAANKDIDTTELRKFAYQLQNIFCGHEVNQKGDMICVRARRLDLSLHRYALENDELRKDVIYLQRALRETRPIAATKRNENG